MSPPHPGPAIEPAPSRYVFPDPSTAPGEDCIAVGGDLEPGTLLLAYRSGLFPMHLPDGRLGWWSPHPRGIIPLDGFHRSRSLRRSMRRYTCTLDRAFEQVVAECADPGRPGGWIKSDIVDAYTELHRLGWAHSVETWQDGRLVGGFYGVAIGAAFFGESMFHRARDASKVALGRFVGAFAAAGGSVLDVQWATDHLTSLGAVEVDRDTYLDLARRAVAAPALGLWSRTGGPVDG